MSDFNLNCFHITQKHSNLIENGWNWSKTVKINQKYLKSIETKEINQLFWLIFSFLMDFDHYQLFNRLLIKKLAKINHFYSKSDNLNRKLNETNRILTSSFNQNPIWLLDFESDWYWCSDSSSDFESDNPNCLSLKDGWVDGLKAVLRIVYSNLKAQLSTFLASLAAA